MEKPAILDSGLKPSFHANPHACHLPRWERTILHSAKAGTAAQVVQAASIHAQAPVRLLTRLARRAHAVSAALGRFHAPRTAQVHSNRPLQPLPLLRSPRWRLLEVTPQYVCQPHAPHQPGSHRRSSPPSRFSAPMRTARTHARTTCSRLRCGAGCRGDFGRTDRVSCHTDARGGILGCSRGRNRTVSMVPHTYAAGSGFPGAIQQPPALYMHPTCISQRACSLLAAQSAQIGRQRPLQLESRVSPSGRASTVRISKV